MRSSAKYVLLKSGLEGATIDDARHLVAHTVLPVPVFSKSAFRHAVMPPRVVGRLVKLSMRANQYAWTLYGHIAWVDGVASTAPGATFKYASVAIHTDQCACARLIEVTL